MPLGDLEQEKNDVLNRTIAQGIVKELDELRGLANIHGKRWGFELVQNALDAAKPSGVSITLTLANDELEFRHDGRPFRNDELIHLIYHGSTKLEEADKSGKLGTGFLATHLLSPRVEVLGSLNGVERFKFVLDREAKNVDELLGKMQQTWNQLAESLNQDSSTDVTIYKYNLAGSESKKALEDGLALLRTALPYILAFDNRLQTVELVLQKSRTTLTRRTPTENPLKISIGGESESVLGEESVLISSKEGVTLALPLANLDGQLVISDVHNLPRFYYPLPFLGTAVFPVPVLIFSASFESTTSRLGVVLTSVATDQRVQKNRQILGTASELFEQIVSEARELNIGSLYNLARISRVDSYPDWLDAAWTRQYATGLITKLRTKDILVTYSGKAIAPANALIPYIDGAPTIQEKFWRICKESFPDKVPSEDEFKHWISILKDWSTHQFPNNPKPEQLAECFTIERLVEAIDGKGTLETIASIVSKVNPEDWLRDVVQLVLEIGKNNLLEKWKILPNQKGTLARSVELFKDPGISEELKNIAEALGLNIRSTLLSRTFEINLNLKVMTEQSLVLDTLSRVKELSKTQFANPSYEQANVRLLDWLASTNRIEAIRDSYPVITRKRDKTEAANQGYIEHITKEKSFIAPQALLAEGPRKYCDIFPADDVLSDVYSGIAVENFNKLVEAKILFKDYTYGEEIDLDDEMIRNLATDELPDDERRHKSKNKVSLASMPFLRGKGGILDRTRRSKKEAVSFLNFILEYVIRVDKSWNTAVGIDCECESKHELYPSDWLCAMKTLEWVPVGRGEERPSSENLGPLFKSGLLNLLRNPDVSYFLGVLGVNASVILTSSKSKKERIDLDNAYNRLLVLANLDSTELKKIAEAYSDLDIRTKLEDALKLKHRIQTNQKVGEIVENRIREGLADALPEDSFTVERVKKGSDVRVVRKQTEIAEVPEEVYEVEQEEDYTDESGREILLDVKVNDRPDEHLIEVKSTFGQNVRMTLPQVEQAVMSGRAFSVCVVRLDQDILGMSDEQRTEIVLKSARFVRNIGPRLAEKLDLVNEYKQGEAKLATATTDDIELDFQELTIRMRLWEQVWSGGEVFDSFVKWLASRHSEQGK